jgi:hypothetical protein
VGREIAQDLSLGGGRLRYNRVESGNERDSEGVDEVENVLAILAAPDAEFVLERDHADAAVVEGLRRADVVGLNVAPDAVADFGRIGARLAGRVDGHDLTFADCRGEVVREGGNSALTRDIGGYESGPRDELAPVG